jgi:hypothetical protein
LTSFWFVSCFFILWGWGFLGSRATIQGSSRWRAEAWCHDIDRAHGGVHSVW